MSKPTSETDTPRAVHRSWTRHFRRFVRRDDGVALIGFGFTLPLLVAISFGILEFTLLMFEFHRATEATRRGARLAAISAPVTDISALGAGSSVTCTLTAGAVACSNGAATSSLAFNDILTRMQDIFPAIAGENLHITYANSGIGDPDTPGGILPMVTVDLVDMRHDFMVLQAIPGSISSITLPRFTTNFLAGGQGPSSS